MIPDGSAPLDATSIQLDHEISEIQAQISSLKAQRSLHATNILSSQTSQSILKRLRAADASTKSKALTAPHSESNPLEATLLLNATKQAARNQECLYRYGAGITSFKVHDPDPNAVDKGNILGLRIDVGSTGKFIRPYYIMLNKPYPSSNLLRVHRHTVPPCIPLSALAARYLPIPMVSGTEVVKAKKQDLSRFARSLRNEVVAYHNRMTSIKRLRKEFKLDEKQSSKGKERERVIVDICAADAEIKQVKIDWVDGRVGRCLVDDKGKVLKCVIFGEDGRDRETERRIMGGDQRMEGIGERLMEGIY